jgi:hypothetical protein
MCGHTGPGESPLAQGELIHVIKVSVNNAVVTGTSQRAYRAGERVHRTGGAGVPHWRDNGRNVSRVYVAYRMGGAGVLGGTGIRAKCYTVRSKLVPDVPYERGWRTVRAGLADGRNAVLYGRNGPQAYRTGGAGVQYGRGWQMGEMLYCTVETGPRRTVRAGLADGRNAVLYGRNWPQANRTGGAGVPYGRGWQMGETLYCTVETGPRRTVRAGLAYRTGWNKGKT